MNDVPPEEIEHDCNRRLQLAEMSITYRLAGISDIETLVDQRMRFFRDAKPEMDAEPLREPNRIYYAETLPTGECVYWLAMHDDRCIGGAGFALRRYAPGYMLRDGVSAYVFNVFVEPDYRKRGIAKEIMRRLMDEARKRGIGRLDLHATEAGRPLYEKLGFEPPDHVWLEWYAPGG